MTERFIGTGGCVAIDSKGKVGVSFTSKRMVWMIKNAAQNNNFLNVLQAWAYQKLNKVFYGIENGDHLEQIVVQIPYET